MTDAKKLWYRFIHYVLFALFFVYIGEILTKNILKVEYFEGSCPTVRLHHVVPYSNKRLRVQVCDLYGNECVCQTFVKGLQDALNGKCSRKKAFYFSSVLLIFGRRYLAQFIVKVSILKNRFFLWLNCVRFFYKHADMTA